MRTTRGRRAGGWLAAAAVLAGLAGLAGPAGAQSRSREGRVFVGLGGGVGQHPAFAETLPFEDPLFGPEGGELSGDYPAGRGAVWEGTLAVRVAGGFALGVAAGRSTVEHAVEVSARLPHPFFYDRPRTVGGVAESVAGEETFVDLQARWMIEAGRSFEITLFAGPSFVRTTREFVTRVHFEQAYPFDEAAFAGVERSEWMASRIGGHAGADVTYYVSGALGVGGTVRYRSGAGDLDRGDLPPAAFGSSGIEAVAGLRLRF